MSIGRSREEQELTSMIAKTLVQREVMEPMSKIGWGHGTPPPPESGLPAAEGAPGPEKAPAPVAAGGQPTPKPAAAPAPTAAPKADTPTIDELVAGYEALRDPETGLIARKYKTPQEAIKGGVHLTHMAKQAFTRAEEAERKLAELSAENMRLRQAPAASPAAAPQPKPTEAPARALLDQAQARLEKVLSDVAENGGVFDGETMKAFSRANREVADAAADVRVQERFAQTSEKESADRAEWAKVDAYMKERHPAAERFSEEVALHLQSDPLLASAVNALLAQGNRTAATELAWTSFERSHGDQIEATVKAKAEDKESELAAREQVRKEQVEKARKDAGVIQGSAGGAGIHQGGVAANSREEIEASRDQMRREGDAPGSPAAMRFRQMIIPLDPAVFGPR